MSIQLKITKMCGRCGKSEEFLGDLEDAQRFSQQAQVRAQAAAHIEEFLAELAKVPEAPQFLVATLNAETQVYEYKTLYDMCSKDVTEEKQRRGCQERVAVLVADLFNLTLDGEAKVRKPRVRKSKAETEVEGETVETAPTDEETGSDE